MIDNNLTPSEGQTVFRKARGLLENGWCTETMATNKQGEQVPYSDAQASSFCILGAVGRALHDEKKLFGRWRDAVDPLLEPCIPAGADLGEDSDDATVAAYNDHACASVSDAIALLDKAIARLETSDAG